ncbi:DNA repair protein RadC [Acidilutibacter cellobiosedens]|jgi:DNA repair protein RadC|uniref:DNA repair protein RadC n=1 Tax=Acidilutibacter cellobiosedens TaxID=2507161 RepID=A0A410QAI3_9FIRM|nr:DNA repair protein RadC [Acidilutibacter cellobiosedens]QAT60969.1 DNA repair protein RadC [Acidilutibacter cellobiosedens]
MPAFEELRYIQAFARIIGVKEDAAIEYAQRKGLNALVDNATQLLTTPVQREKHQAFLDLYRMSSSINTRNPIISSPNDASAFFHSIMEKIYDKEAFVVAFLNTKNRIIDHEVVSVGTINSSIVHPREVFRNAIINKANSVILCHNHPSGDINPSAEDITITRRLKETGEILGISVLDHLIINGINQNKMYSFKEKGVLEQVGDYITSNSDGIAVKEAKKEKKISVVEQLKNQSTISKEKQKTAPISAEMER